MKLCGLRQDVTMQNGKDVILNTGQQWEFLKNVDHEWNQTEGNHKETT